MAHAAGIDLSAKFPDSCFHFAVAVAGYLFFSHAQFHLTQQPESHISCTMLLFFCDNTGPFSKKIFNMVMNSLLEALRLLTEYGGMKV